MTYVITKLVKSLKRGGVIDWHENVLEGSKFYSLFHPETLRLVTPKEFAKTAMNMNFEKEELEEHWASLTSREFYFECGQSFLSKEDSSVRLDFGTWFRGPDIEKAIVITDLHGRVCCQEAGENAYVTPEWKEGLIKHLDESITLAKRVAYLASTLDDDMKMPPIQIGVPRGMPGAHTSSFLTFCSLRSYTRSSSGEHTALDRHGVRRHWVRPFDRDIGKPEKSKVRGHWRGDPRLGIVRKVFVAKGTADETPTT